MQMVVNPKQSHVLIWGTFCNFICTIFNKRLVKSADGGPADLEGWWYIERHFLFRYCALFISSCNTYLLSLCSVSRTSFCGRETAIAGENVQGRGTVDHPVPLGQLISHPAYIRRAWAQTAQVKSLKLCPKMEELESQGDCLQSPGPSLLLYSQSQTTAPLLTCFEHPLETRHLIKF